jgi:hypothetical protein
MLAELIDEMDIIIPLAKVVRITRAVLFASA